MYLFEFQISVAVLLDLLFGDPRYLPHPVKMIGYLCIHSEKVFRKITATDAMAGVLSFTTVLCITIAGTALLLVCLNLYSPLMAQIAAILFLYTSIAAKDLVVHSRRVYSAFQNSDNLDTARNAVAQIVGRDTRELDKKGIIRACIETVAENMVDGVTAPLFFAVFFSLFTIFSATNPLFPAAIAAMGYKAVNTMDSMFGYKNEEYLHFGRAAAKFDDFVNFIPARISALMIVPAAFVLGGNWRNSFMIVKRDRLAHASPNAAHSEAAFAGALDVELGGVAVYSGNEIQKPTLGDNIRPVKESDILLANRLMLLGSLFFLILLLTARFIILQIVK